MNGIQPRKASRSQIVAPTRLPIPRPAADLYHHLGDKADAHPVYALAKMVKWLGGDDLWLTRLGPREKFREVRDHGFGLAAVALNRPSLQKLAEKVRARRAVWLAPLEQVGLARRLVLTARTDAMVWLVSPGPLELGLALHHVYGFPFLPGSSLKGLARRVAQAADAGSASALYGSQGSVGPIAVLDGFPCPDWKIQRDVMTPHFRDWYQGKKDHLPDDTENPVPIPFLCIAAGSRFEVALLARDTGASAMLDAATRHLRQGLDELGLGAKTAAGYGVFGVDVLSPQRQTRAPATVLSPTSESPQASQVDQVQAAPMRSPQAEAAERRIRAMRLADVSGLSSLIDEVRACAEADRAPLFQLLRRRVEEFVPKRKDREALLQKHPELRGEEP